VLLCESGWVTHLRGQLDLFSFGTFIERLAERFTVIRYDKPGCGLSDRDGIDLSFDGQVAAALAVADAVRADRFTLFGASQGGQLAAAIAAQYPDRVEALVLYGMCANGADLAPAEVRDSIVALVRAHWGLGSKVLTGIFVPDPNAGELEAFLRFQRASASAAVASELLEVYYDTDIRSLLPGIRARTAVLHREADRATGFELGREVASLTGTQGTGSASWSDRCQAVSCRLMSGIPMRRSPAQMAISGPSSCGRRSTAREASGLCGTPPRMACRSCWASSRSGNSVR
jgi:pimeloyl-ACP methyl ester carboxylesterase